MDGGFEELGPFELAVALMECPPAVEAPGVETETAPSAGMCAVDGAGADGFEREGLGRTAGAGHGVELAGLRIPDEGKAVAAQAGTDRLHKAEHGVSGNGRIDRRAAALEHLDGSLRGEGMRGAGRAVESPAPASARRSWRRKGGRRRERRGE